MRKIFGNYHCIFRKNSAWLEYQYGPTIWNDISNHVNFNSNHHPIWQELLQIHVKQVPEKTTNVWVIFQTHSKKFSLDRGWRSIKGLVHNVLLNTCIFHWRSANSRDEHGRDFRNSVLVFGRIFKTTENFENYQNFQNIRTNDNFKNYQNFQSTRTNENFENYQNFQSTRTNQNFENYQNCESC